MLSPGTVARVIPLSKFIDAGAELGSLNGGPSILIPTEQLALVVCSLSIEDTVRPAWAIVAESGVAGWLWEDELSEVLSDVP